MHVYLRSPSGSNDSSGIVNDNLHDSTESDLRVCLVDNGLVGPYSATVLVTLSSAPDHRPPRLSREQRIGGSLLGHRSRHSPFSPGSSTSASSVRSLNPPFFVNSWWLP
ncbi:hypothetical protein TNCV_2030051 [Trichonephila clavipes]|nr:hypothetical protein TNCV_2030051 [Trichonephila clavipes]